MNANIYLNCPTYETESFYLRLVKKEDALDLLSCYSDKTAVEKMNADNCNTNFYFQTKEEMEKYIYIWLEEYKEQHYVRLVLVEKNLQKAVGTMELFGGEYGVLRIDIASNYEQPNYIEELVRLTIFQLISDFDIEHLEVKVANVPGRLDVLKKYGFVLSEHYRIGQGYYERKRQSNFEKEKGMAYCGLACCVCSENSNCVGCRNEGCKEKDWCKSFQCGKTKNIKVCSECSDFPCESPMFQKIRVRTFAKFCTEHSEKELMEILKKKEKRGILYHYPGQLIGDYDMFQKEEELKAFLLLEHL